MNQLSAALNRARSSLEHVNRLLDRLPHRFPNDDERRQHSDSIEEPIIHGYGHEQREPEAGIDGMTGSRKRRPDHGCNDSACLEKTLISQFHKSGQPLSLPVAPTL